MKNDIEKQEKKDFVSRYLSPMLRKADSRIYSAEYEVDGSGNELVTVTYLVARKRIVHVTGDSLTAFVTDVMRGLK